MAYPNKGLLSLGGFPLGLQGKFQLHLCPWCVVAVSLHPLWLLVATRKGFCVEFLPVAEQIVWRLSDQAGDMDITDVALNVFGLPIICQYEHSEFC